MTDRNENRTGYKNTKLGWIPEEWELVKLGGITVELKSGLSRKLSSYDIGVPVLRSNNLIDNKVDFTEIRYWYLNDPQGANTENYFLKNNDILVNFINSLSQIGKCAKYKNYLGREVIYTTNIMRLRLGGQILVDYFLPITQTHRYAAFINSITKPAVNQASFTTKDYKSFLISLPPLAEQEKIAEILGKWDEGIEKVEELIAAKRKMKKALCQQLLTGIKRFKEFQGQKWEFYKAGDLFRSFSQKNNDGEVLLSATQDNGVIPRHMLEGKVTMPEGSTSGYKLVVSGDFVISLRSFQGGLEYSEYRGIVSPAYTVLKPKKEIDESFYKHYFKSYNFIGHLAVAVIGIRDGKQISYGDFTFLRLPYPCIREQQKIASVLNTADEEIEFLNKKLESLKQQKKGLMQKLLTGKIRVKV